MVFGRVSGRERRRATACRRAVLGSGGALGLIASGALGGCAAWERSGGQTGTGGGAGGGSSTELVFGSQGEIVVLSRDGKTRKQLTKVATGAQARDPAWSRDGARIAYAYTPPLPAVRGPGGLVPLPVTDVHVMNADGSGQKVLVAHEAPGVGYETPVWAPDGGSVYVTYTALVMESNVVRDQVVEVARVMLGSAQRQTLISNGHFPALSPDGRQLACILTTRDGQSLVVGGADGKNVRPVVPAGQLDGLASPRFSPDGKQLVFSAVAPRASTAPAAPIPTLMPRGSGGPLERLGALFTPGMAEAHGLPMDIYVVSTDGGPARRLTELFEDNPAAAWSPDGKQVVMLAGGGVYLVSATGGDAVAIDTKGGHGSIDWKRS